MGAFRLTVEYLLPVALAYAITDKIQVGYWVRKFLYLYKRRPMGDMIKPFDCTYCMAYWVAFFIMWYSTGFVYAFFAAYIPALLSAIITAILNKLNR